MVDQSNGDNTKSFVALSKGTMVSHYRIVEKIGSGGMGEVYLAEDTTLKRMVALKFMPSHLATNADMRERFMREARAVAALSHPNIVTIYEVGEFNGRPYFAMEHVVGESLRTVIKQGRLTTDEAVRLTMQICVGLQKAHEMGVVHRDIKPGNIIIDNDGRARILDFGLAMVSGEEKLTKTGSTLGTVGYMSPEQVKSQKVDHRSDLFSVGVILYEMLTGRRPFEGDNDAAVVRAITSSDPEPVARFKSGVTGQLQQIIDKALTKDPSLRYQHADGMLADLKRLELGTAGVRKDRLRLWVAMAVVAVIGIAGYYVIDRYSLIEKSDSVWGASIAVLPFRDFSPNRDQEYFCDGITDAIIGRLSGVNDLKVISMTSVMRYRSSDRDLKEIGKRLDVENVLEGSVQKEGDSIRVRVQLIRVKDDAHLWSDQFDREIKGVFAIQDNISRAIVEVLRVRLAGGDEAALARRETNDIEAYNLYMHGRYLWRKRIGEDILKSIEYFERAIELDPMFTLAYSGLADAWSVLPGYAPGVPYPDAPAKAKDAAQKAVGLDDRSAEAHASLGLAFEMVGDVEQAEREYLRAIELNPGYAWAHLWYSNILPRLQKADEKIKELELTIQLDPLCIVALKNLADIKAQDGQYIEADSLYQRVLEITPDNIDFRLTFARFLNRAGKIEEAVAQCEQAIRLDPRNWMTYYSYALILRNNDRDSQADSVWARAISAYPKEAGLYHSYGMFAYYILKDYDESVALLTKAIELDPSRSRVYNLLAYVYDAKEQTDKALQAVNIALGLSPGDFDYLDTKAEICYRGGLLDTSIAVYRECLELRPNWLSSVTNMARACVFARQYDRADSLFNVIVRHAAVHDRGWGRQYMTTALRHQGRFAEAMKLLEQGIEADKEDRADADQIGWKHWVRAFICRHFLYDYPCATAEMQKSDSLVLTLESDHPTRREYLISSAGTRAKFLAEQGQIGQAEDWLRRCDSILDTTSSTEIVDYWYYHGHYELAKGNYDGAVPFLERVLEARPDINIFQWLGFAYLKAGRYDEATTILERAVNRYDISKATFVELAVWTRYNLARAYEANGQIDKAIEQYETFLDIWKNADEGIAIVDTARTNLKRLKNES